VGAVWTVWVGDFTSGLQEGDRIVRRQRDSSYPFDVETGVKWARKALIIWVPHHKSRLWCCINGPCFSADLTRTKRIVGRRTDRLGSAASFLPRLT
jgi:hypothetical protein